MKTQIPILILILLLAGSPLFAQVTVGIKAAPAMATMNLSAENDLYDSYERIDVGYVKGFQVGFLAEFPLTEYFAIQPELLYTKKGYQLNDPYGMDEDGNSYVTLMKNYYLTLPVLAKAIFTVGEVRLSLQAGPSIGWLANGQMKWIHRYTYVDELGEEFTQKDWTGERILYADSEVSSRVHRYDFGLTAGAGIAVPLGCTHNFLFDLRYDYGFTDLHNWSAISTPEKPANYPPLRNRVISAAIGISFGKP